MGNIEKYLGKAFTIASIYLVVVILGGFFILPSVFQIEYHFPIAIELFLKITATLAVFTILSLAVIIPVTKLFRKQKSSTKSPVFVATATLFIGLCGIFLHGLYVKLRTCSGDNPAWYCHVKGMSYVGMLVLAFFLASLLGFLTWIRQKLKRKN